MSHAEPTFKHILVSIPASEEDGGEDELLVPVLPHGEEQDDHFFIGLVSREPCARGRVVRARKPLTAQELANADVQHQGGEAEATPGRVADLGFLLASIGEIGEGAEVTCRYTLRGDDLVWEIFDDRHPGPGHWRGELAGVTPEPWVSDEELAAIVERRREEATRRAAVEARIAEEQARRREENARRAEERARRKEARAQEQAAREQEEAARLAEAAAVEMDPDLAEWLDLDYDDGIEHPEPVVDLSDWLDDDVDTGDVSAAADVDDTAGDDIDADLAAWLDDGEDEDEDVAEEEGAPREVNPEIVGWLDDAVAAQTSDTQPLSDGGVEITEVDTWEDLTPVDLFSLDGSLPSDDETGADPAPEEAAEVMVMAGGEAPAEVDLGVEVVAEDVMAEAVVMEMFTEKAPTDPSAASMTAAEASSEVGLDVPAAEEASAAEEAPAAKEKPAQGD